MNYTKNYNDYIEYVKTLSRMKANGVYYEKHHIIPRCCGGTDNSSNLVLLTAREHFLAHYLLTKMYKNTEFYLKLVAAAVNVEKRSIRPIKKERKSIGGDSPEKCGETI